MEEEESDYLNSPVLTHRTLAEFWGPEYLLNLLAGATLHHSHNVARFYPVLARAA